MTSNDKETLITAILLRQIGHCVKWKAPSTPPLLGERYLEVVTALGVQLGSAIETQRVILQIRDHEELAEEYDKTGNVLDPALNASWEEVREEIRGILKASPVILAGLGRPDCWPDYEYWSRMEHFTKHEVVWLSLGLEPRFTWDEKLSRVSQRPNYISPFLEPAQDHLLQIERFIRAEMLNSDALNAGKLLDWIVTTEFPAQDAFKAVLKKVARRRMAKSSDVVSDKPIDKRELAAAQKIIAAMAIDGYGYDVTSQRSPIPGQIQAACDEAGVPVSRETVLKHLRAGTKHLPDE